MANEKRVRVNNCIGTLGAFLAAAGTAMTFGLAPNLPTIDTTKHAAIILEPDTVNEEIVYVTAFTAGATTATVLRGQEGTTAVDHPANVVWVHGPTKRDTAAGRLAFAKRTAGSYSLSNNAYSGAVLADAPIGYWKLDETSGTAVADSSGNARNGTFTGTPTLGQASLVPTDGGKSANLTSGLVDLGNLAAWQATTLSYEVWFKVPTSLDSGFHAVFTKNPAWGLFVSGFNLGLYNYPASTFLSTGHNVCDNAVHHVVVTVQSGVTNGTKIYLDGTLVLTTTTTFGGQTDSLRVGAGSVNTQYLGGQADEASIYSTILTQAQVTAHYNAGLTSAGGFVAVDTGLDLVVPAFAGDIVEVGLGAFVEGTADLFFDVASVVGGNPVNYWAGTGAGTDFGIPGWAFTTGGSVRPESMMRQLVAGDLASGLLTARLMYRGGPRTLDASAARPLQFWAKNHGPQEAA